MRTHLFKNPPKCRHERHDFWLAGMSGMEKKPLFSRQKELSCHHATMPALFKTFTFFWGGDIQKHPQLGGLAA